MPQIPLKISEETIPGKTGSPNMPMNDPIGEALEKSGKQIEGSGLLLVKQQAREQHLKDMLDAQDLAFDFKEGADSIIEEQARDNSMTSEHVAEKLAQHKAELLKNPKYSNPEVQRAANAAIRTDQHTTMSASRNIDTKRLVDRSQLTAERVATENAKLASLAETPEERDRYLDITEKTYDMFISQGVFYENERPKLLDHLAIKYFKELELTNPADALEQLNDPMNKATQMLSTEAKSVLTTHLKSAARKQTVSSIIVDLQEKYVDNPQEPNHKDGTPKSRTELMADAWKEITSTEFRKQYGEYVTDIEEQWSKTMFVLRNEHKVIANEIMDRIGAGILKGTVTDPSKDKEWNQLEWPEKKSLEQLKFSVNAQRRAEANAARSLAHADRAERDREQQKQAMVFFNTAMTKMTNGTYTDTVSIINDFNKTQNPYVLAKVNSYMSTFTAMNNSPELKDGLKRIEKAEATMPAYTSGALKEEFRMKFIQDETFRGDAIDKWLQLKLEPEVRSGVGGFLQRIFRPTLNTDLHSAEEWNTYGTFGNRNVSQADLEYTAKKHGISIDEVKKRLGIQ